MPSPDVDKVRAQKRAYYHRFPEKQRRNLLWKKYRISLEQFNTMFSAQGGLCAVCRTDHPQRRNKGWAVDHDHATKKVRGILCHRCNLVLGMVRDCPTHLQALLEYVLHHA
jgi:Recombination endonuclease VII